MSQNATGSSGLVGIFVVGSYAHMCTPLPVVENLDVIEQIVFYFIYCIILFTENEVRFLAYKKRP